jgi:hypothetical protein
MIRHVTGKRLMTAAAMAVAALGSASCGEVARTGQAPVQLVIELLEGASGAEPDTYTTTILSDVLTLVEQQVNGQTVRVPTIFNDLGRVTLRTILKNSGGLGAPLEPTSINQVTIYRYRVAFKRADGRNTPGVDVPYGFDGAFTITIPANGNATGGFDLVRHQLKLEPPLRNLINGGNARFISTIAEITFYGRDQAGNEVTAVGMMNVNFGDWADPD